ncbi:MAG TPA: hypothetical protein DCY93_02935 [Firmicutes bacterium]|nr:hypothetical protein [Bacillota bacterium]
MKFLKTCLIIFSGLVIFSAVVSYGGGQSVKEEQVEEDITQLETAVNNGEIITDGIIEDDRNPNAKPNAIGEGANAIGQKTSNLFSSILKMVGDLISSLL